MKLLCALAAALAAIASTQVLASPAPAPRDLLAGGAAAHESLQWTAHAAARRHRAKPAKPAKNPSNKLVQLAFTSLDAAAKANAALGKQGFDVWALDPELLTLSVRATSAKEARRAAASGAGLDEADVTASVQVHDIEKEMLQPERAARQQYAVAHGKQSVAELLKDKDAWFSTYHELDDIYAWYTELAGKYPLRVRELNPELGKTHEGRNLMSLRITSANSTTPVEQKKQLYIQCGIHAREWISHAMCQLIAHNLATSEDERVTNLLDAAEVVMVPVVNPDGYAYTWSDDRLWRKNRRDNGNGQFGVDCNRNYPAQWGKGGSSTFPGSDTYMGPGPASEPEVATLTKFFLSNSRIVAGLDMHAYSQLILRPLGWERGDAPHEKEHKKVGDEMARVIKKVHGKAYRSIKSIELYATTGAASDWFYLQRFPLAKSAAQADAPAGAQSVVPYGITIELRPDPSWWGPGFVLPPREIIPTGEEIFPAVLHFWENALKNTLFA